MSDSHLKAAVDAYRAQHPGADPEACDQFHLIIVGERRRNGPRHHNQGLAVRSS